MIYQNRRWALNSFNHPVSCSVRDVDGYNTQWYWCVLFVCFCYFLPYQQYFSYILPIILCMRWGRESPTLHFTNSTNVCLLLFYGLTTVFQLYHGSDMMYESRRRKSKPTLLLTQGIFNLPHHIGKVWQELAFVDAVSYRQRGNGLQHS